MIDWTAGLQHPQATHVITHVITQGINHIGYAWLPVWVITRGSSFHSEGPPWGLAPMLYHRCHMGAVWVRAFSQSGGSTHVYIAIFLHHCNHFEHQFA